MDLPWVITVLALSTSFVGWLAKLWWSKEYRHAKEAEIDAKDAQIELLKTENQNLRELTPMKLEEMAKATGRMLTGKIDELEQELDITTKLLKESEGFLDVISFQLDEKQKLEEEVSSLQAEVTRLNVQRAAALEIEKAGYRLRHLLYQAGQAGPAWSYNVEDPESQTEEIHIPPP